LLALSEGGSKLRAVQTLRAVPLTGSARKTSRTTALFPPTPSPRLYNDVNAKPQPPSNPWQVSLNRAAYRLDALVRGCWWDGGGTKEVLCLPLVVPLLFLCCSLVYRLFLPSCHPQAPSTVAAPCCQGFGDRIGICACRLPGPFPIRATRAASSTNHSALHVPGQSAT
jgi:hypothetical protein